MNLLMNPWVACSLVLLSAWLGSIDWRRPKP